jgi:tRNA (adenine57-N1/adenine58-N1)-methyltransferase
MVGNVVALGDKVVLISKHDKRKYFIEVEDRSQKILELGVYNPNKLVGQKFGSLIRLGTRDFWVLKANFIDTIDTLKRKAQIILPKDSALIGLYGNIHSGSIVIEGGLGSGALTIFLLKLVGETGKVTTYEVREDFAKYGKKNVVMSMPKQPLNWDLKVQDITHGIQETEVDAVVLDIPEPWNAVAAGYSALRAGGILVSYIPTMNQVENMVKTLKEFPFIEINSFENLQRDLVSKTGATRPAYEMLGHTGYIVFGRKVIEK